MITEMETLGVLVIFLIVLIAIWEIVWKAIGMWKAARNNDLAWFIAILLLNTAGILPILYIYVFAKEKKKKHKRKVKEE